MTRAHGRVALALIFAVALVLRLAYWSWAPGALTGDDFFYSAYAERLLAGSGFVELDGSPAAFWMPGWPLLLAGWYGVFGADPQRAMLFGVVLGSATALGVALLGQLLTSRRVGVLAGAIYALWPGNVYYTATLLSEPAFGLCLVAALALLAIATRSGEGRCGAAAALAAGAGLGFCALVKAEPLVLLPVFALAIALGRVGRRARIRDLCLLTLGVALLMGPWVARNRIVLDRWIVTSLSGGTNFWIGNHPGATGGNDFGFEIDFRKANPGASLAESNLRQNASGWLQGLRYLRDQPLEALARAPDKLMLSYASDHAATANLAGTGALNRVGIEVPPAAPVAAETRAWLARGADLWWFGVLAASALGLLTLGSWSAPARVILLGVPAAWLAVHAVFLGGPRFHAPETVVLAILAACGIDWLGAQLDRSKRTPPVPGRAGPRRPG